MYNTHSEIKMGQMLSREDEDESCQTQDHRVEEIAEINEKPKRRHRNPAAARSRKPRASAQCRTQRNRAN